MDIFKRNEKAEKIRAFKRLFDSDDGRVVLRELMTSLHFSHSTFDADPSVHAFKEGERAALLRIIRTANIDANKLEEIMREDR